MIRLVVIVPLFITSSALADSTPPDEAGPPADAASPRPSPPAAEWTDGAPLAEPPAAAPTAPAPAFAAPPREPQKGKWYGWQTLICDAGAGLTAIALAGKQVNSLTAAAAVGGGAFALCAPIVHALHGSLWKSAVSITARTAFPLVGYYLATRSSDDAGWSGLGGIALAASSMAFAVVLDAVILGREPPSDRAAPRPDGAQQRPTVSPTLAVDARQGLIGLGGTF